jgi:hypothetical protein
MAALAVVGLIAGAYFLGKGSSGVSSANVTASERTPAAPSNSSTPLPSTAPTPNPSPTPPQETATFSGAASSDQGYLCPPGTVRITSEEKRQVLAFWNQSAEIWNAILDSIEQFDTAIPSPYTFDNARASGAFRSEAARHRDVLNREINELVALRAAGIPEIARAMSLRVGDLYDLLRLMISNQLQGINSGNVSAWNYSVDLQDRRDDYIARAETEIVWLCGWLK